MGNGMRASAGLAVLLAACGGGSAGPSAATPQPTPIPLPSLPPLPAPGVVASGWTGQGIAGGRIDPPLSAVTSDAQILEISAPGHFSLRTTRGFLRQKQDRIYLIPVDFDGQFFDAFYWIDETRGYGAQVSQWNRNALGYYIDPGITAQAVRVSIATAMDAGNRLMTSLGSPIRFSEVGDSASRVSIGLDPAVSGPVTGSFGFNPTTRERITASIRFRDGEVPDGNLLFRYFFFHVSVGAGVPPERTFASRASSLPAPTELDIAALRIFLNRCANTVFEDERGRTPFIREGRETELRASICLFPAPR